MERRDHAGGTALMDACFRVTVMPTVVEWSIQPMVWYIWDHVIVSRAPFRLALARAMRGFVRNALQSGIYRPTQYRTVGRSDEIQRSPEIT